MTLDALREQVAAASRELAADGLVLATAGNVSARDGDLIAITPTGGRLKSLRPDEVSIVDRSGRLVDGQLAPSSELELHLRVYDRHDAGAVIHTHAPMATALSCVLTDELPCIHYGMLALGGAVPVAGYHTFGTAELADTTVAALDGHLVALMANHGTIARGSDLAHAVDNTHVLEWACTVYRHAAAIGTPRAMSTGQLSDAARAVTERDYGTTRPA